MLAEHFQIQGKDFIEGIATSAHADLAQQLLLYRVHLENGFSTDINVGFVEIIMPEGQEIRTDYHVYMNDTTYREEDEAGGRPSSCDEFDNEDDDYSAWAPELLHNQSQNLSLAGLEDEGHDQVQEGDMDVQEATRLLMSYGEVLRGTEPRLREGEHSRSGRGRRRGRSRGPGKAPMPDQGAGQRRPEMAPAHDQAEPELDRAPALVGRAARAAAAAYNGGPQAAPAASSGGPQAAPAATSTWAGIFGGTDYVAGPSQRGFQHISRTPSCELGAFFPVDSSESDVDGLEEGSDDEGDPENVRFAYHASTWSKNHQTYDPEPMLFEEESFGLTGEYTDIPSYIHLFEQFWTFHMLRDICLETNRYAGSLNENGRPRGGRGWYPVTVRELKAFLATSLYMGMKKLPNVKAYWAKSEDIFYCNVIAGLFTRKHFMTLTRCLHITDPSTYVADNTSPHFDKMHQTRWLIDAIREACKRQWNLGQYITVDETMVRYKGTYCPARQYMPKKPVKWGVKVWCVADSKSKFIYDFDVYCGKSQATLESRASTVEEQNLAHRVVTQLTAGLDNKGHVVVMDNYFTSVGLFRDLER
jgi:hypothetical protein